MIKDDLKNVEYYYNLSNNIKKGLEWLKNTDLATIECGKYEIDGQSVFANIQVYETKDQARYELHRKYIDIQCVIEGKEFVGVCGIDNGINFSNYSSETDLQFLDINTIDKYQTLSKNEFLIIYPHEAHKPSISINNKKEKVKKVVVKVAIN